MGVTYTTDSQQLAVDTTLPILIVEEGKIFAIVAISRNEKKLHPPSSLRLSYYLEVGRQVLELCWNDYRNQYVVFCYLDGLTGALLRKDIK